MRKGFLVEFAIHNQEFVGHEFMTNERHFTYDEKHNNPFIFSSKRLIEMSYVPPHLRKKLAIAPVVVSGVRFLGNVIGNNIVGNTGTRFSPHKNAKGAKKTLKIVKRLTPNVAPPAKPTTAIRNMPPKFRNMIKARLATYKEKTRKHKKHKKQKKHTRKIHRHK